MDNVSGTGTGYGGKAGRKADVGRRIDFGPAPFVVNVNQAARENENFRRALWTGNHLQMTLMSIPTKLLCIQNQSKVYEIYSTF